MKKFLSLLTSAIVIAGCTSSGDEEPVRLLKSISIEYLDFANDFRFPGTQLGYTAATPYETTCFYSYLNGHVNKVTGGFKPTTGGTSVNTYVYSPEVTDTLVYNGNEVNVYTKPEISYFAGDQPSSPTVYKLNNDGKIIQFTRRDGYQIYYKYDGNTIVEKNSSGDTLRLFYMENQNLVKIIKNYKYTGGVVVSVSETLFDNFDESPNPLRNKYFLVGAFYRSFSKNNFTGVTQNYYVRMTDGTFHLLSTSSTSMPVNYDQSEYPEFGEYNQ
jgi:hypothetical protein